MLLRPLTATRVFTLFEIKILNFYNSLISIGDPLFKPFGHRAVIPTHIGILRSNGELLCDFLLAFLLLIFRVEQITKVNEP